MNDADFKLRRSGVSTTEMCENFQISNFWSILGLVFKKILIRDDGPLSCDPDRDGLQIAGALCISASPYQDAPRISSSPARVFVRSMGLGDWGPSFGSG
jgi:hypothetical protein